MANKGIEVAIGGDIIRSKRTSPGALTSTSDTTPIKLTDIFRQYDPSGQYIAKSVIIGDGAI